MEFIQYGRRGGKTAYLLNLMRANPDMVMVVINHQEADRLAKENQDIAPNRFIPPDIMRMGGARGHSYRVVLCIDNVDMLLHSFLNTWEPIVAMTATPEEH